jgi:hypothetical protein
LEKEGADDVIGGTDGAFDTTILGRSVGAREAKRDAVGGEVVAEVGGEELATIVTLHTLNGGVKLCVNECEKAL